MKRRIDLGKAGDAEGFGALAVRRRHKKSQAAPAGSRFTRAQARALSDLAHSFVEMAREAGADHKLVKVGGVSLELHENGIEEVLSIRKAVAS